MVSVQKTGHYIVYLLFRLFYSLFSLLPLRFCFLLGAGLGVVAYYLFLPYRRLAIQNLELAFANEKSRADSRKVAKKHFLYLGANFLSGLKITSMRETSFKKRIVFEGRENLEEAYSAGKGVIYATMHLSNWEVLSQCREIYRGEKSGVFYQRLGNPFLDQFVRRLRSRMGAQLYDRRQGFHQAMKLLREKGVVALLCDQHAGDSGVWCPFFGRLASTTSLPALMALRTGARILPLSISTEGIARWKVVVHAPHSFSNRENSEEVTASLNRTLEDIIRQQPQDWFWVHNRWKTPRPNFLLSSYKRKVIYPPRFSLKNLKPFRILLRSPNWLGDACMAAPAVRAIKSGRPDAELTLLCPEKLKDLWASLQEVDRILSISPGESLWNVAQKINKEGPYAVAILFPLSLRSALEVFFAGIPHRAGYAGHHRRYLLNHLVREPKRQNPPLHHQQKYLRMAENFGAAIEQKIVSNPSFHTCSEGKEKRIGLCAGAEYGPAKRWPLERFAAVANKVSQEISCQWILLGSPNEKSLGRKLASKLEGNFQNKVGETTLQELIEELKRCHLLLTNDTGTMHLAALLDTPTVSIFGSTEPALTGPWGENHRVIRHHVNCSPCFLRHCPRDFQCMDTVEVEEVYENLLQRLQESL